MKNEKMVFVNPDIDLMVDDFEEMEGKDHSQNRGGGSSSIPKVTCKLKTLHLNLATVRMLDKFHMVNLLKHKTLPVIVFQPTDRAGENTLEVAFTYNYSKGRDKGTEEKMVTGASLWAEDFFKNHQSIWDKMQGYTFTVNTYPNGWLWIDYSIPYVNGIS